MILFFALLVGACIVIGAGYALMLFIWQWIRGV